MDATKVSRSQYPNLRGRLNGEIFPGKKGQARFKRRATALPN